MKLIFLSFLTIILNSSSIFSNQIITGPQAIELDQQILGDTSVYVCVYDNNNFLVAKKNKESCFCDGTLLSQPTKIVNNRSQRVFPGGSINEGSTVLEVAEKKFKSETGLNLSYFDKNPTAVKFTAGAKEYYAVYLKANTNVNLKETIKNVNGNLIKNNPIRAAVSNNGEDDGDEEYFDESINYDSKIQYVKDDVVKCLQLCERNDAASIFRRNNNDKFDQSWFLEIAQRLP